MTDANLSFTLIGFVESSLSSRVCYVAIEFTTKTHGTMSDSGSHATVSGSGQGKGVMLFDAENGREIAGHIEGKEQQTVLGTEEGEPFEFHQAISFELSSQTM